MRVVAFDFWDTKRELGIGLDTQEVGIGKLKKDQMFTIDDVTYIITKIFKSKSHGEGKLVETRMVKYKIPNTVTTHVHKCPAKMVQMRNIDVEQRKELVKKYGESTVNGWQQNGRVKLKIELAHQCPECKVVFYKDAMQTPEAFQVTPIRGKKKLKQRK